MVSIFGVILIFGFRVLFLGFDMDLVTALPTDEYGSTYIPDIKESLGECMGGLVWDLQ